MTIDTSLSTLPRLEVDEVPALLDSLGLPARQRQRILTLVARFAALENGSQDRAEFAVLLDDFRRLSPTAYQRVGKPMFLTFLRRGHTHAQAGP